jgi:hypothetical protein
MVGQQVAHGMRQKQLQPALAAAGFRCRLLGRDHIEVTAAEDV